FQQKGSHEIEFSTRNLPAGMYFARLQYGSESQSVKLIKVE
ncbi:MAG TPA: T9SS type A sorting domain-containing protein, partial [Bacteroidetes bacterium]|nr:T9SS type A sorting domain-containing protein [Bacteroidota bacterium]